MDTQVRVVRASLTGHRTPLLVVNLFEGVEEPGGATGAVDQALDGLITRLIGDGEISGSLGEVTLVHNTGDRSRLAADRVAVVGLGKRDDFNLENARVAAATVARRARDINLTRFATIVHGAGAGGLDARGACSAVVEASLLSLYTYDNYKSPPEKPATKVATIEIIESDTDRAGVFESAADDASKLCDGVYTARDLSQGPGNVVTPTFIADRAREMCLARSLECTVWGPEQLRAREMRAILAVAQGSVQEPRLVTMWYRCGREGAKTLAVVGKGVTFDSGGISIKPGDGMEHMKHDMSGAATVVGFVQAAADLKLGINVLGVFAAVENMPSGTAYKPGDVIKAMNGKMIEVINTDAEGRVILADALAWAAQNGPEAIIDLATLTGACVVALGHHASGAMSNDEAVVSMLRQAGDVTGERIWPLPLWKDYAKDIESSIGDIKNTGGRPGGALTAAAFLHNFVDGKPWVHLDIAGTAYTEGRGRIPPYLPNACATGVGVRLIAEFARRWGGA